MSDASLPVGVVLAAGRSRRMGSPKAWLTYEGETFLARVVRLVAEAGCGEVRVVLSEGWPEADPRVRLLSNPDPDRGQLSSLQIALAAGPAPGGALMALVDHPAVRAATYRALLAARDRAAIVIPTFEGRRGHPVWWGAEVHAELVAAAPEEGARVVVWRDPARVLELDVGDPGILADIDRPEDYQALLGWAPKDLDRLLELMVMHHASDLELKVGAPVVLRVAGRVRELDCPPLDEAQIRQLLYGVLTSDQVIALEASHRLEFVYAIPGRGRFRLTTLHQHGWISVSAQQVGPT